MNRVWTRRGRGNLGSVLVLTGPWCLWSAQEVGGQGALQPGVSHTEGEVTGVGEVCRLGGKEDERKAWRRLRRATGKEEKAQGKGITEARGVDTSTESDPRFSGRSEATVRAGSMGGGQNEGKQGTRRWFGCEDSPGMGAGEARWGPGEGGGPAAGDIDLAVRRGLRLSSQIPAGDPDGRAGCLQSKQSSRGEMGRHEGRKKRARPELS